MRAILVLLAFVAVAYGSLEGMDAPGSMGKLELADPKVFVSARYQVEGRSERTRNVAPGETFSMAGVWRSNTSKTGTINSVYDFHWGQNETAGTYTATNVEILKKDLETFDSNYTWILSTHLYSADNSDLAPANVTLQDGGYVRDLFLYVAYSSLINHDSITYTSPNFTVLDGAVVVFIRGRPNKGPSLNLSNYTLGLNGVGGFSGVKGMGITEIAMYWWVQDYSRVEPTMAPPPPTTSSTGPTATYDTNPNNITQGGTIDFSVPAPDEESSSTASTLQALFVFVIGAASMVMMLL